VHDTKLTAKKEKKEKKKNDNDKDNRNRNAVIEPLNAMGWKVGRRKQGCGDGCGEILTFFFYNNDAMW
jgi:hypothetical protein